MIICLQPVKQSNRLLTHKQNESNYYEQKRVFDSCRSCIVLFKNVTPANSRPMTSQVTWF